MNDLPNIPWDEGADSEIFANLANAFLRLLRSEPVKHVRFVELVEEGGRVKITQLNVALEAGEHRQRFEKYPRLSRLIRTFKPTHGVVETTTTRLNKRAERIRELETMLGLALSKQAEAIVVADDLRAELAAKEAEIQRLKDRVRQRT
jgi:hypothetical protein